MRIERLNSDKIKVTLTTADLLSLDIRMEQLAPDSKELHAFLFHIMETIREETDFNPYSGQVVVEATPSNDGISILISKMSAAGTKRITKSQFVKAKSVEAKRKMFSKVHIFYFKSFDDMCLAIKEMHSDELLSCALYKLNDVFCCILKETYRLTRPVSIFSEFATKKSTNPMQAVYIKEHGKLIAKNKGLAEMAIKIRQII